MYDNFLKGILKNRYCVSVNREKLVGTNSVASRKVLVSTIISNAFLTLYYIVFKIIII